uniref:Uncharacterized protein n=1 Tax=Peronospora matthiolae TaxID=2874970 RepID=A0AAV1UME1_9STRA
MAQVSSSARKNVVDRRRPAVCLSVYLMQEFDDEFLSKAAGSVPAEVQNRNLP